MRSLRTNHRSIACICVDGSLVLPHPQIRRAEHLTPNVNLPPEMRAALDQAVAALKSKLQENLHSLIIYGSAVRGNVVPGVSDLNLLVVLREPTAEAHLAIGEAIRGPVRIEPFVLSRDGIERSLQAFAIKFRSIRRHYRVLHGEDLLANLEVDEALLRFLCEQAVRNLRLRITHAFITMAGDPKRYTRYLVDTAPDLFTDLAEALRLTGTDVPTKFADRIGVFERNFTVDASVLKDLLALKNTPRLLSLDEAKDYHGRLFRLLNQAVCWMEKQWPPLAQPSRK